MGGIIILMICCYCCWRQGDGGMRDGVQNPGNVVRRRQRQKGASPMTLNPLSEVHLW